jgi:RHS repeat-associated protein
VFISAWRIFLGFLLCWIFQGSGSAAMALQKGQWGAAKLNPQLAASGTVTVKEQPVVAAVAGSVAVEYVRGSDMGGGVGGLLYSKRWVNGAWVRSYDLANGRGDVTTQTNQAGAVTWQASYEAFGMRTAEAGTNLDPQRGNTKDEDPTGLSNQGHRYLDLETGVWLSRDPAGFVDGPNLYCYVRQNPWSSFDPEGLAGVSTGDGINSTLTHETREDGFSSFGTSGARLERLPEGTPPAEPEAIKPLSKEAKRAAMERQLSNSLPDKPVADLTELRNQLLFEGTSNQQAALAYHLLQTYHRDSPGYKTALEVATCSANAAFLEASVKEMGIVILTTIAMEAGGVALQSLRVLKTGGTLAGDASLAAKGGTWGAGGSGYTLNPLDLARKRTIFSRAEEAGIGIDRSLSAGQSGGLVGGVPTMRVQPFSTSTVAIEEYLHARFAQRLVNRHGLEGAQRMMADPAFMLHQELRLKSRMIGAGERGVLGSAPMKLNLDFLLETRAGYQALSP